MLKKQITVFAISTLISCLALTVVVNLNIAALILPLIYIAVFAVETVHSGAYYTAITVTLNITLALILSKDLFTTFVMEPLMILSGILTGITVIKNYNNKLSVLWGILATGGVYAAYILFSIKVLGFNPVDDMFFMMEQMLKEMSVQMDMSDLSFVASYINMSKNLFVAVMIIVFSIIGFVVAYIASSALKIFRNGKQLNLSLDSFKADTATVFIYIGSLIGAIFAKDGMLSVIFMDLYLVLQFYLTICGVSLIYYLIKKKINVPVVGKIAGIALLGASMVGIFSTIFVLGGIIDARRNFRSIK